MKRPALKNSRMLLEMTPRCPRTIPEWRRGRKHLRRAISARMKKRRTGCGPIPAGRKLRSLKSTFVPCGLKILVVNFVDPEKSFKSHFGVTGCLTRATNEDQNNSTKGHLQGFATAGLLYDNGFKEAPRPFLRAGK